MGALLQMMREMGQARLLGLVAAALLLIGGFGFFAFHAASPAMSAIYTDLSLDDSAKIVTELEKQNVPYELRGNGSQILVPSDQMLRLRLTLAQAGLPSGGSIVGYEIFDRSEAMGTSSFVMNINMIRALEGELARTIAALAQVESARVNLVVPRQELFAREHQEPTASVMLKLRGTSELSKDQIGGISHLIAAAVPGLKPSHVTLVDNKGHMLSGGGDENESGMLAASTQEHKLAYETHLKTTLESLLEKSVGIGKVKVTVNADIDFDRVVTNSEVYDPNGQVARSVQTGEEKEQSNEREAKDNTSVANNLPNAGGAGGGAGSNRVVSKTDETTNYEISKTVENHVKESGKVSRLSVAVLVDGLYADDSAGKPVYTPRSDDERRQLETLVKSAIGFDEKRGDKVDVVNMRFIAAPDETVASSPFEWLKQDFRSIVQTLVFGGVAVLVVLLVIRPLVNRVLETTLATSPGLALEGAGLGGAVSSGPRLSADDDGFGAARREGASSSGGAAEFDGAGGDEAMIGLDRVTGRVRSSLYHRLNEIIQHDPEEALGILRQWTSKRS